MTFSRLSATLDLRTRSHRGLTGTLIPAWLRDRVDDLDGRIESSAYGETPPEILDILFRLVGAGPADRFLDLGAGAGNLVLYSNARGVPALGLERNPALVESGREILEAAGLPAGDLREADFLTEPWPEATLLYAATARFSRATLEGLAARIDRSDSLRAVGFLGRPVELGGMWRLHQKRSLQVRWNLGEESLLEPFWIWLRSIHDR